MTFSGVLFNLWFTIRNRSSTHREFLYKKQVEEYEKLLELFTKYGRHYFMGMLESPSASNKDAVFEVTKEFNARGTFLSLYASASVNSAFNEYFEKLWGVTEAVFSEMRPYSAEVEQRLSALAHTSDTVVSSIRASLGFEELSKEIVEATRANKNALSRIPFPR